MGSFSGTCEIVEAREELNTLKESGVYQSSSGYSMAEKNLKLPAVKLGYKYNLDDDINKLFESINLKSSSRDLSYLPDGTSPRMKSALKKPMIVGIPRSPRVGTSEPVTLKQALRDLCISKASEMAATKRLSKSGASPRISEVGKIQTLYNSVVADDARRSGPSNVESKRSSNEISLVLEESKSLPLNKESQSHQTSKSTLSRNAHSSKIAVATPQNDNGASLMQSDLECSSSKVEGSLQSSEPYQIENQTSASSSISCCNTNGSKVELCEKDSSPKKLGNKASMLKNVRKGMLQTTSSSSTSVNGSRVCKLSRSPRTVKLAIKNKDSGKKKLKQGSDSALSAPPCNETNNKSVPASTAPLVCERCWCEIENTNIENSKGIVTPGSLSPADGINLKSMLSGPASAGCNSSREVAKVKKNSRLKEQLEFSQSSKSSQGDYSSSTSTSDESNVSGSSCGNRPHMSKDYRWQAIRDAQVQHRVLGLRHFNLLKKLGCGDIGTVYLSELIGQNCLFAIKVMDNEFLARRKKMPRAQTEREILRMLDHPFLPTLYAQFTSENLSCLVMEYCPGGDLHVLRQKQLGRCFSEPAARYKTKNCYL